MSEVNKKLLELMVHTGVLDEKLLQERVKKAYYEGQPIITDEEYDELFPVDYVGCTPEQNGPWEVVNHVEQMGSLDKLKTWEEAQKWLKDKSEVLWQPKLDGLSLELKYIKGILESAVLRGDGEKGENILKNALKFQGIIQRLPEECDIQVKGEVVISQSNFLKLTGDYSNRRNCIPGIARRYDGLNTELLTFYAYTLEGTILLTEELKVQRLHDWGFKIPFTTVKMTEELYNSYGDIRDTAIYIRFL